MLKLLRCCQQVQFSPTASKLLLHVSSICPSFLQKVLPHDTLCYFVQAARKKFTVGLHQDPTFSVFLTGATHVHSCMGSSVRGARLNSFEKKFPGDHWSNGRQFSSAKWFKVLRPSARTHVRVTWKQSGKTAPAGNNGVILTYPLPLQQFSMFTKWVTQTQLTAGIWQIVYAVLRKNFEELCKSGPRFGCKQWRIKKFWRAAAEGNVSAPSLFITNAHNKLYAFYTRKCGLF